MSYSDSEDEERVLSSEKVPRFRNIYNFTKAKADLKRKRGDLFRKINNAVLCPKEHSVAERQRISESLKTDANIIVSEFPKDRITVVCAMVQKRELVTIGGKELRSKCKKFVFTNLFEYVNHHGVKNVDYSGLVEVAEDLGYHVVQTQQSHAEVAMLQFLGERRHVYKAVPIAIGCSNHVCQLCGDLLDIVFGKEWPVWFNSVDRSTKIHHNWFTPAAVISLIMENPEKTAKFRDNYQNRIPEYADHWVKPAPDFVGCTDRQDYPVWKCSNKEGCFKHGLTFDELWVPKKLTDRWLPTGPKPNPTRLPAKRKYDEFAAPEGNSGFPQRRSWQGETYHGGSQTPYFVQLKANGSFSGGTNNLEVTNSNGFQEKQKRPPLLPSPTPQELSRQDADNFDGYGASLNFSGQREEPNGRRPPLLPSPTLQQQARHENDNFQGCPGPSNAAGQERRLLDCQSLPSSGTASNYDPFVQDDEVNMDVASMSLRNDGWPPLLATPKPAWQKAASRFNPYPSRSGSQRGLPRNSLHRGNNGPGHQQPSFQFFANQHGDFDGRGQY